MSSELKTLGHTYAGDDAMVEQVTNELCATHKCDPKVFNSELIKLVGSQGVYMCVCVYVRVCICAHMCM